MGEIDDDAVLKAAKLAGVHDLILSLKDGYETQLGGTAAHISGGQIQRIGLALALYSDPSFVVLDEPNANLDTEFAFAVAASADGLTPPADWLDYPTAARGAGCVAFVEAAVASSEKLDWVTI